MGCVHEAMATRSSSEAESSTSVAAARMMASTTDDWNRSSEHAVRVAAPAAASSEGRLSLRRWRASSTSALICSCIRRQGALRPLASPHRGSAGPSSHEENDLSALHAAAKGCVRGVRKKRRTLSSQKEQEGEGAKHEKDL